METRLMAAGLMGILVVFSLLLVPARAGPGDELDVIAPMEFNTETITPAHEVVGVGGGVDEPEEKPKPPVPIYKITTEKERSWLEDAVMILAMVGLASFLFLIFYARRQKKSMKRVIKDFRKRPPEIGVQ